MVSDINIGIDAAHREQVSAGLGRVLADSQILYQKTKGYHWNVTGPLFGSLHAMFEQQYTELAVAIDTIAERIRALGLPAPSAFSQYAALGSIAEDASAPAAQQMAAQLATDNETVSATARQVLQLAQTAGDEATADLLVERMQVHEKTAWMMRSVAS